MSEADPGFAEEGSECGPKKSFWEHLKDLRGVLVKSAIAIGAALLLCLTFAPQLVNILEFPLRRMEMFEKPSATVTYDNGVTRRGPFTVTPEQYATLREQFPDLPAGPAAHVVIKERTVDHVVRQEFDPAAHADEAPMEVKLHNFSPAESFVLAFHVAMYGGLALSSPFWIYFLGTFILPALHLKERRLVLSWMGWSVLLFAAGVLSTYFLLLPVALKASMKYSELLHFSAADWRADDYIHFVCKFLLGMGIGFQFPLVVLFLVKLGMVTHQQLARYRRHVIVLTLILGAVLTTPEVITQIAMAVPLYLLYETCIWIAWYWDWKKRRAERDAAAATG
jgi:sec-independent protein translocase protein TatC